MNNITITTTSILLILYFIYICYIHYKTYNIEPFYTFFLPYQLSAQESIDKYNKITDYKNEYIFERKILRISSQYATNKNEQFVSILTKLILANSKYLNVNVIYEKSPINVLKLLINKKVDFSVIPVPVIDSYNKSITNSNIDNEIQFVVGAGDVHMYALTTIYTLIQTVGNLKDKRVGIEKYKKVLWTGIIDELQIDNNQISEEPLSCLINNLKVGNLDIIFITEQFPSSILNDIVNNDFKNEMRFLSFNLINDDLFLSKYKYYYASNIDLNLLPRKYLPVTLDNVSYSQFNPYIKIYKYKLKLVTHKYMDKETIYNITKIVMENINIIKQATNQTNAKYNGAEWGFSSIFLQTNNAARQYYLDKGYISDINNENCKYIVNSGPCNNHTLEKYSFF